MYLYIILLNEKGKERRSKYTINIKKINVGTN